MSLRGISWIASLRQIFNHNYNKIAIRKRIIVSLNHELATYHCFFFFFFRIWTSRELVNSCFTCWSIANIPRRSNPQQPSSSIIEILDGCDGTKIKVEWTCWLRAYAGCECSHGSSLWIVWLDQWPATTHFQWTHACQ